MLHASSVMQLVAKVGLFSALAVFGYVAVYGPDDLPPGVKHIWSITPDVLKRSMPALYNIFKE